MSVLAIERRDDCQLLADQLGVPVPRPQELETTAAFLAGPGTGLWSPGQDPARHPNRQFEPTQGVRGDGSDERWLRAVARSRGWESGG